MTIPREAKLAMPIEVAAKRVGNILGCKTHTAVNAPTTPTLAQATSAGNSHPGLELEMKRRMMVPAMDYSAKNITKIVLGL